MAADVGSTLASWSTTESSNAPAGTTPLSTNLDDNLRMIQAVVRQLASDGTIASATTTDLSTIAGTFITVSGTTTIAGLGTVSAGIYKWLIFSGALTLTHNATSLILPGAANITTADGTVVLVKSLGSGNWRCLYASTASSDGSHLGGGSVATNVAVGATALDSNTTGANNVAIGNAALTANSTGGDNTAVGSGALDTSTGSRNTAVGKNALGANTTASDNSAFGVDALKSNTTGAQNIACGGAALGLNVTGNFNSAFGNTSLYNNTGSCNVGVGYNSLYSNTSGSGNTSINPMTSGGVDSPVFNPTTESNRFIAGSTSVTNAYIQVAWTVVSDARDKTEFSEVPHGLAFVNQLKPIAYRFRESRDSDTAHGPVRYGFRAQDVMALEGGNPVIVDNEDADKLRMVDTALIPVLVNAIQELSAEFNAYKLAHP